MDQKVQCVLSAYSAVEYPREDILELPCMVTEILDLSHVDGQSRVCRPRILFVLAIIDIQREATSVHSEGPDAFL